MGGCFVPPALFAPGRWSRLRAGAGLWPTEGSPHRFQPRNLIPAMAPKRSPLHGTHERNRATFMEEGGWEVPANYGSIQSEYATLRNHCGLIDLCHLARYRINGPDREFFVQHLTTIGMEGMEPRTSHTAFMLNESGGIIDAIIIYKDEQYILLNGHADNRSRVLDWIRAQSAEHPEFDVEIVDVGTAQGQIELRGPSSRAIMEASLIGTLDLGDSQSSLVTIGNARCLLNRRRFCGTDGYMIIAGSVYIQNIYDHIMSVGRQMNLRPAGEEALDIFRIEAGLAGVGRELDEDVTPIEIGGMEQVQMNKGHFVGKRALLHHSAAEFQRRMVLVKASTGPPRAIPKGEICFDTMSIGYVTSSVLSPAAGAGIALGFVDAIMAQPGTRLFVRSGQEAAEVEVIRPQFSKFA